MESCPHQHIDKIVSENTLNTFKVLNTAEQPHRARNSPCSRELIYSGERRNIDSCTLKWKRGYRHSHSPMAERIFTVTVQAAGRIVSGEASLGLSRHQGQFQRRDVCTGSSCLQKTCRSRKCEFFLFKRAILWGLQGP